MIEVYLFKRGRYYHMKPCFHGKLGTSKSSRKTKKSEARKVAEEWKQQLEREDRLKLSGWCHFVDRYEDEKLAGSGKKNKGKFRSATNKFLELTGIEDVGDASSQLIAQFIKDCRAEGMSDVTLKSYLGYLDRAFRWASKKPQSLIEVRPVVPEIKVVDDEVGGRPIRLEEFERLKMQIEPVVGEKAKQSWEFLLDGLWCSGLRLNEALNLAWSGDSKRILIQTGEQWTLRVPGTAQKKRKTQICPIAPEFVRLLKRVPQVARTGKVFQPMQKKFDRPHTRLDTICKRISKMGENAKIIVKRDDETGEISYASAHDLRRSFGLRWAKRLPSIMLKNLMRHRSIQTTEKYYAQIQADEVSRELERFEAEADCQRTTDELRKNDFPHSFPHST